MSILSTFPWTVLIIIYMVAVHAIGISMEGAAGLIFLSLCVIVLMIEFIKSGDIKVLGFLLDIIFSVLALVAATALLTYLYFCGEVNPTFYDWIGFVVLLGDAIVSPFNSFRTGLRNLEVSGGIF
jgi:prolipoprotein diacylglyceryltransferase